MGLAIRYNTADEIPEDVRGDFVEDTVNEQYKGTWVSKDLFAVEKSLYNERREHKETKAKISAINEQMTKLQGELEKVHELGTLEELMKLKEDAAAANPPKIEELLNSNKEMRDKLREATKWRSENEPLLAQLQEEKQKFLIEADRASAKEIITKTVKGINGVNGDALSDTLYYQYLAGNLKRNDIGEIVTAADGAALEDFASKYAKEHGLILQNTGGGAKPPSGGGGSTKAALEAKLEEAKKRGDSFEMLRIKTELGKLTN